MHSENAREKHIEYLKGQKEEAEIALANARTLVLRLERDLAYLENALHQASIMLHLNEADNSYKPDDASCSDTTNDESRFGTALRSPKEMLQPEFSEKTLADVILLVLNSSHQILNSDDIAQLVFDARDAEEYGRAKNSLSTELRRGAKEGRWRQVGRGLFASNKAPKTDFSDEFKEEYKQAENLARKAIAENSKSEFSADQDDTRLASASGA